MMMRGYSHSKKYVNMMKVQIFENVKRRNVGSTSSKIKLTKTDFMRGWRCTKRMYLHKHKSRLGVTYTPPSLTMKHLAAQGIQVGRLAARTLFPNGTDIVSNAAPKNRVTETRDCVEDRDCKIIYEAHFEIDDITVACDIIVYDEESESWDLYEVKSSSKAKENYILDAAMQAHVVSKIIPIRNVHLVLIDTSYENKSPITSDLFNIVDITSKIPKLMSNMDDVLEKYKALIRGDDCPPEETASIGHHCMKPHVCEFRDHCWKDLDVRIQNEPNIFNLANGKKQMWDLYYNHDIVLQSEIPEDYELTKKQQIQIEANRRGRDDVRRVVLESCQ